MHILEYSTGWKYYELPKMEYKAVLNFLPRSAARTSKKCSMVVLEILFWKIPHSTAHGMVPWKWLWRHPIISPDNQELKIISKGSFMLCLCVFVKYIQTSKLEILINQRYIIDIKDRGAWSKVKLVGYMARRRLKYRKIYKCLQKRISYWF